MNKTLKIFMYKGNVCAHCEIRTGTFVQHPATFNPPRVLVTVEHTSITSEAKKFIKNNFTISEADFSFTDFIKKDDNPIIDLFGYSNIFIMNELPNTNVILSKNGDISIIDMIEEQEYLPNKYILNALDQFTGIKR